MKRILSILLLSTFTIASYAGTISIKDWYGTGFALKEGYVVTNYHVVDGTTHVYIKGVGGDFSQEYAATVVEVDKENDLAIVKIDDSKFTGFGNIPYSIQTAAAEIGEDIFVLGYPMTDVMGEEIKLTTGVINSCSGYKGDNRSYQISAPIQPGNSGGPLFNNKGEVIGVVNAKLLGAENAGYAIKAQYLSKYLNTTSDSDFNFTSWVRSIKNDIRHFFTKRSLSNQSLVEQVKMVKNHVFIVKCCLKPKLYKIEYTTTNNKKLSLNSKKSVALHTFEEGKGTVYLLKPIVPEYLFSGRRTLKSVVIQNGITSIGDNAFEYCYELSEVNIPNGITEIGRYAFQYCTSLKRITIPDSVSSIQYRAFDSCSNLIGISLPKKLRQIDDGLFAHCSDLEDIKLPNSITSIGAYAFYDCDSIRDIIIPANVTLIKEGAFKFCDNIISMIIPDKVTTIEDQAFHGCRRLTNLTLGKSVSAIGSHAFSYCNKLTNVYCRSKTPPDLWFNAFAQNSYHIQFHVSCQAVEKYKTDANWYLHRSKIVAYD